MQAVSDHQPEHKYLSDEPFSDLGDQEHGEGYGKHFDNLCCRCGLKDTTCDGDEEHDTRKYVENRAAEAEEKYANPFGQQQNKHDWGQQEFQQ